MTVFSQDHPKKQIEKKILKVVRETIHTYQMFHPGDSVLVAVSGGPDSVTLLHVLCTLAPEYKLRLGIGHLNHCLRHEEADRDAEFVTALGQQFDLPCYSEKRNVMAYQRTYRLSLEEAARRVRYQFCHETAHQHGFNKIALGHTGDDNAELMLMYLLRGSGPLGLSGIPPVRNSTIVRPIIRLKRSEVHDYITEKNLAYVLDASNIDPKFLRNKIRHQLIPELKVSYNPRIIETLNRLGSILRAEDRYFEDILQPVFEQSVSGKDNASIRLSVPVLESQAKSVKRRIIRKAILAVKKDLRRISLAHVDAALQLLEIGPVEGRLNLPDGIRIFRNQKELVFCDNTLIPYDETDISGCGSSSQYQYEIAQPGSFFIREVNATISLHEIGAADLSELKHASKHIAYVDMEHLQFPLVVRNFRPGDRFSPLGLKGTQKVKKYFINNKVPRSERQKCPIVLSQDKIIWIAGHRIDNHVKVSARTHKILKAELILA